MHLQRFDDVRQFYERAGPFLEQHEPEHCLMLGLCSTLIKEPTRYPEPYLALVEQAGAVVAAALRTPPWPLVLSLTPEPAALESFAVDLASSQPGLSMVVGPRELSRAFAEHWQRRSSQRFELAMAERIYCLERVQSVSGVRGHMRRAGTADIPLIAEWMYGFILDAFGEADRDSARSTAERALNAAPELQGFFLWEDGEPVSMASYKGPTPHGIRIGEVYTPPEQRRRGYASALVAELSQLLLDGGRRFCFLFTDLKNSTSNKIYQQIGYQPVMDVDMYRFEGVA